MDDLLKENGISAGMATLAHLGTQHLQYMPWMQATYIMAAKKEALQYLPADAKLDSLTYDQLGEWAANAEKATGRRMSLGNCISDGKHQPVGRGVQD
jgi:multiple sugar transport system substrate-binding protein